MSIFVLRVSGFGSVWTYPVLVDVRVWFQFGLCLSWRSCCVFPVSLLGASLLVLSWCGRAGQLGLPSCLFVHASALERGWGVLCWVALSSSLAPLLPRLLLWVSGGLAVCLVLLPGVLLASPRLGFCGCSRFSLRALRLLPRSGSGGFSVLAVFRFWVLTCWFLPCRFWF